MVEGQVVALVPVWGMDGRFSARADADEMNATTAGKRTLAEFGSNQVLINYEPAAAWGDPRISSWPRNEHFLHDPAWWLRVQPVDATVAASLSAGVAYPSVLWGRVLSWSATSSRSAWVYGERSVPFGKYCRNSRWCSRSCPVTPVPVEPRAAPRYARRLAVTVRSDAAYDRSPSQSHRCRGCHLQRLWGRKSATAPTAPSPTPTSTQTILATRAIRPNNLVAPIGPTAISLEGAPINPFGIVRSALDQGPEGHPASDLPSAAGTPVLAVAAGRIVTVGQAEPHHLAGQEVRLLIGEGPEAGTGWVFLYTHVALAAGIRIGTEVAAGRPFANSPLSPSDGNHFELAWAFNYFRFHQDRICWVHQLNGAERTSFEEHFNTVLRTDRASSTDG